MKIYMYFAYFVPFCVLTPIDGGAERYHAIADINMEYIHRLYLHEWNKGIIDDENREYHSYENAVSYFRSTLRSGSRDRESIRAMADLRRTER